MKSDFDKLDIIKNENFIGNRNSLNEDSVSIGRELSFILNVDLGDSIVLMSPASVDTIVGSLPKQKKFIISSIFDSGLSDFDSNVAFINIKNLEEFF